MQAENSNNSRLRRRELSALLFKANGRAAGSGIALILRLIFARFLFSDAHLANCASGTSGSDVKRALLETHVFPSTPYLPQDDDRSQRWVTPAWYNVLLNLNETHPPTWYVVASFPSLHLHFQPQSNRNVGKGDCIWRPRAIPRGTTHHRTRPAALCCRRDVLVRKPFLWICWATSKCVVM